jgi:hypothetical protein
MNNQQKMSAENQTGSPAPSYNDVLEQQLQDYSVSVLLQTILFILIFVSGSAWTTAATKSFSQGNKLVNKELALKLDWNTRGVRDIGQVKTHIAALRTENAIFIRKYFIFALALTMVACAVAISIGVLAKSLRGSIRINLSQIFAAI